MVLKAIGKYIDTLPINDLLSQEEVLADSIVIEIDRYYNGYDLADFTFFMRGVTPSGGETQEELDMTAMTDVLQLLWHVDGNFTSEGGRLSLDLYGCLYAAAADPAIEMPEAVIRFQMPPVQVRPLPESKGILDSQSYTEFLLEVRATANDAIAMIEQTAEEIMAELPDYDDLLTQMSSTLRAQENEIAAVRARLTELENKLSVLEARTENVTPVTVLTQSEFDALELPSADTLYVITA